MGRQQVHRVHRCLRDSFEGSFHDDGVPTDRSDLPHSTRSGPHEGNRRYLAQSFMVRSPTKGALMMQTFTRSFKALALDMGVAKVGVACRRDLEGPPEADMDRIMPGAKAAISMAPLEPEESVMAYLSKEDPQPHRDHYYENVQLLGRAGLELARSLRAQGHRAEALSPNGVYAQDSPPGQLTPPFAHRYAAHAAGVGAIGLSGNLMTPEWGARVYLSTVITDAPLEPDGPLENNPCDDCGLCLQACAPQFMNLDERVTFKLGEQEITHAKKGVHWRCGICCSGFTGLSRDGRWPTPAPSLRPIPEEDGEALLLFLEMTRKQFRYLAGRPADPNFFQLNEPKPGYDPANQGLLARAKRDTHTTCGNCAIVCLETKRKRARALKTLRNSGVVIGERADRSPIVVSAEKAEEYRRTHAEPYMEDDGPMTADELSRFRAGPLTASTVSPFFRAEPAHPAGKSIGRSPGRGSTSGQRVPL